jgi:Tfp pilus assembly protein PilE
MELVIPVVVVAVLAALAVAWLVTSELGRRSQAKRLRREKVGAVAEGHREMAEAHASTVAELEPQANGHREAAADHARIAAELEGRIARERRHVQFHEERADDSDEELDRI